MGRPLAGAGSVVVAASADQVWAALLDPAVLCSLIPGAERVEQVGEGRFRAVIMFGVSRLRSRCEAGLQMSDLEHPCRLTLAGDAAGLFGGGSAVGHVTLAERTPGETMLTWRYAGTVSGPMTLAGGRLLRVASDMFVNQFFQGLTRWAPRGGASPSRRRTG